MWFGGGKRTQKNMTTWKCLQKSNGFTVHKSVIASTGFIHINKNMRAKLPYSKAAQEALDKMSFLVYIWM